MKLEMRTARPGSGGKADPCLPGSAGGWAVCDSSTDGLKEFCLISVTLRTALSVSPCPSGASGWPRPARG